jgi:hypothetical protein
MDGAKLNDQIMFMKIHFINGNSFKFDCINNEYISSMLDVMLLVELVYLY